MKYSKLIAKVLLLSSVLVLTLTSCQKEKPLQPGELLAQEIEGSWKQISYFVNGEPGDSRVLSARITFIADQENTQEGRYENKTVSGGRTKGQYAISYSGEVIYLNNQENNIVIEDDSMLLKSERRDRRGRMISTLSYYTKL